MSFVLTEGRLWPKERNRFDEFCLEAARAEVIKGFAGLTFRFVTKSFLYFLVNLRRTGRLGNFPPEDLRSRRLKDFNFRALRGLNSLFREQNNVQSYNRGSFGNCCIRVLGTKAHWDSKFSPSPLQPPWVSTLWKLSMVRGVRFLL